MQIDMLAFDADDTLWHNEPLFSMTQQKFKALLEPYHPLPGLDDEIYQTEIRNLQYFGYGIKGFTLSLIESAITLTDGKISGAELRPVLDYAKEMLKAPVSLLDDVAETVEILATRHPLMIITKGDLFDQESKIARSGLADYFEYVEIVSHKTPQVYAGILQKHGLSAQNFVMVGNSLKSDILPVAELGGQAILLPYKSTWAHEVTAVDSGQYLEIQRMGQLPALLESLSPQG